MWVSRAIFQFEEGKSEKEEMMTNVVNETFILVWAGEIFSKNIFLPFAVTEGASFVVGGHQTGSKSSIFLISFYLWLNFLNLMIGLSCSLLRLKL